MDLTHSVTFSDTDYADLRKGLGLGAVDSKLVDLEAAIAGNASDTDVKAVLDEVEHNGEVNTFEFDALKAQVGGLRSTNTEDHGTILTKLNAVGTSLASINTSLAALLQTANAIQAQAVWNGRREVVAVSAKALFQRIGFPVGAPLDTALAIAYLEGDGAKATKWFGYRAVFADAVGDTTLVDSKWGPSIGAFQIRALRDPVSFPAPDNLRYADRLTNPYYNAEVALAISKGGTDWSKWSTSTNSQLNALKGIDFALVIGHPRENDWDL